MDTPDPLAQLKKMVIGQKSAALPDFPPDPDLQSLHERVVAYDRYVSEAVIGVLGGGSSARPYPDQQPLQQEIDARKADTAGASKSLIDQYQNYKNRLDKMLDLAVRVASTRS